LNDYGPTLRLPSEERFVGCSRRIVELAVAWHEVLPTLAPPLLHEPRAAAGEAAGGLQAMNSIPAGLPFETHTVRDWRDAVDYAQYFGANWAFRGEERDDWTLTTSLQREFGVRALEFERHTYWHFVRRAARSVPDLMIPHENDAAAWLGILQHYGGVTRLLDFTKSFYVALYFAMEPHIGSPHRVVWAIDQSFCQLRLAMLLQQMFKLPPRTAFEVPLAMQAQMVSKLVLGTSAYTVGVDFQEFTGVFPVDPWKPDPRQVAQQALFFCVADLGLSFMENLTNLGLHTASATMLHKLLIPVDLRIEALEQLRLANVSAATLFPGLDGIARSMRTLPLRLGDGPTRTPPWEVGRP
jgi:hypothetical protein